MKAGELVEMVVKHLVSHPDQVQVREVEGEKMCVIEVKASKEDLGKIIGRRGKNVEAIRTLLRTLSKKHDKKYTLEVID